MNKTRANAIFLCLALLASLPACVSINQDDSVRPVLATSFLISIDDLPPNWRLRDSGQISKWDNENATNDSAAVVFLAKDAPENLPTQQLVFHYSNATMAQRVYQNMNPPVGALPTAWLFESKLAEESDFACYDYEGREQYPVCTWMARYHDYIIVVHSWLIPDRMSLEDLMNVIMIIEDKLQNLKTP